MKIKIKKSILHMLMVLMMIGVAFAIIVSTPGLQPADPKTADILTCNTTVTDNQSAATNFTVYVEWTKNGTVMESLATNTSLVGNNTVQNFTLPAVNLIRWDNWSCKVNASNTTTYGVFSSASNTLQVNDTCPTSTATTSPTLIYGSTETVTGACGYADADDDAEGTSTYMWYVSSSEVVGDTDTSLSNANFTQGDTIEFECTPINSYCSAARAKLEGANDNSTSKTVGGSGGSGGGGGGGSTVTTPPAQQQEPTRRVAQRTEAPKAPNPVVKFFQTIGNWFRNFFARFKK